MRSAQTEKLWEQIGRSARGREFPKTIELGDLGGFPAELSLPSPVSVIFGLNGAGKSRLLQSLADSDQDSHLFSVYDLALYLKNDFGRREDVESFKDETEPIVLDINVVTSVRDMVRRPYTAVRWYMVEIDDSPFADLIAEPAIPYFEVDYAGATYDFRTMGMGELSAHLIVWLFGYTRDSNGQTLLMDEPEAFLPAPLKTGMLEQVLNGSLRNGWNVLLATHSLEVIEPALASNVAIFVNEKENVASFINASAHLSDTVKGIYGPSTSDRSLVFVEDEAAMIFAREIIAAASPGRHTSYAYLWCGGYGNLLSVWQHLTRPESRLPDIKQLIFVADGDKQAEVETAKSKSGSGARWPFLCLPGDPDKLFEQAVSGDVERVADDLGLAKEVLDGLLIRSRGREHHRWTEGIVAESQVPRQVALRALARAVVRVLREDHPETLDLFMSELQD